VSSKDSFRIGSLYPGVSDGKPNLILSSSYQLKQDRNGYYVRERAAKKGGKLKADLRITTDPVELPGISDFVSSWLKPQMLAKTDPNSIFNQYWQSLVSTAWPTGAYPNNLLLEGLSYLGYRGYGWDQAANNSGLWAQSSTASGLLYDSVLDLDNYRPELVWGASSETNTLSSSYDTASLLQNLAALQESLSGDVPLWYPAMLYTYGISGKGTSYPGPVLMIQPGDSFELAFQNDITIPGLTEVQSQNASLIPNSSYGLNGGATAGGMFSTNFHMHGGHVNPSGFGDNVVARYTSGQNWTTSIDIPKDHGQGSYWYHPHYHPAVNTQLYGGLSGFMQVGDPLQKIPFFKNTPRNLAVLKTIQVDVDPATGEYQLAAVNGNILGTDSLAPNRASMFTVNGEYMPSIDFSSGGWQALTLSNQDNNYYMNLSIRHQEDDGTWVDLPLFIYGEDGHQYPQIRAASATALGYAQEDNANATGYTQAKDLISLPSGKRIDILFYLPSGQSEIVSTYSFNDSDGQDYAINNLRFQSDQYVDLSSTNTDVEEALSGPGPIAKLNVKGNNVSPSSELLNQTVRKANRGIEVQKITPKTRAASYDEQAVPSVNLYQEKSDGGEIWKPVRQREFNYSVLSLVGPEDQRDIPTQQALAELALEGTDYQRYTFTPGKEWLGYESPDLINDHVFPNGPLIITQLGTMEEWSLKNWNWGGPSVANGGYFVGHPFHIHVNDYQVKQSDTELPNKRSLEDVTMLNASGYHYADTDGIQQLDPLAGTFTAIPEALDVNSEVYNSLYTTGYNDTTIRMLFQDFLGTYVHHCHLLEHEDAGMMQVVTVIENTDSSWLLPAEGFLIDNNMLTLRKADTLEVETLQLSSQDTNKLERAQVGDLSGDFIQDIILTSAGSAQGMAGSVFIYDGKQLRSKQDSQLLSSFKPYQNATTAPWAFNSDFTGDGHRELVTGGFVSNSGSKVSLDDFEITGWQASDDFKDWTASYHHNPWQGLGDIPEFKLDISRTSFAVGDFNLDNFDDYAVSYLVNDELRVRLIDGASVSLFLQSGINQGGYLPETSILSDMTYASKELADVNSIVLTAGFNSYAQSPIENLIVTTSSSSGQSSALTFQLNAGHFIATGQPSDTHSMDSHGGSSSTSMDGVMNHGPLPLQLTELRKWQGDAATATPTFSGVLGQGAMLLDDYLVIGQGTSSDGFTYGNPSSSNLIKNTSQDLFVSLSGIERVDRDDLTGIVTTNLNSKLSSAQVEERFNLSMLAYQAYTNTMVKPSDLATLAAGEDGSPLSVEQLVTDIVKGYTSQVEAYYGGRLADLETSKIVSKAYRTLFQRQASSSELSRWSSAVDEGLAKTNLPMAILQDTHGRDRFHVSLLSAGSRWSQVQWGTSAVIDGAYGMGFQSELSTFEEASRSLLSSPVANSWTKAQNIFSQYRHEVMDILDGTPISDTGFF
jgi:FtsP/CotA-like multicopper oxidase with cupredoxin domain